MTHVFFGVILGGAMPDLKYGAPKMKQLNWHQLTAVALAGVTANFAIILGSLLLYAAGELSLEHMSRIVNMNGGLILFNLLPFGTLDGGRFAKAFFDSVCEHEDMPYAIRMGTIVMIASMVLIFFGTTDPVVVGLLVFGLRKKAVSDDPNGSCDKRAMTKSQQRHWAMFYNALVVASMIAIALSTTTR